MKKLILNIIMITLVLFLAAPASAIQEVDLPQEKGQGPVVVPDTPDTYVIYDGYANSSDVTIVGGVMGVMYYFCKQHSPEFCSDQEGVLLVSGGDTGKIPGILKLLDELMGGNTKVVVKLSKTKNFSGVPIIIDAQILN